jgi:predicted RNA binding protein YcfA (HicA-like mRNA interferase family)
VRRLEREGFVLVSVRGSQHKYRHPVSRRLVIVKHPRKDTPLGTAMAIYDQAGWEKD